MPTLTIVRGLPGSGKSTHAKSMGIYHVEADMFHMKNGVYNWMPQNVKRSHEWCKKMVLDAIDNRIDVVVSNTFTQIWEFEEYIKAAEAADYKVVVLCCMNDFGNTHNVPSESLQKMKNRFEYYEDEIKITQQKKMENNE